MSAIQKLNYQKLDDWWRRLNFEVAISELQAGVCALLSLNSEYSTEQLSQALRQVYDLQDDDQAQTLLDYLRSDSLSALTSWDFSLRLMLPQPEHEDSLIERLASLREWCQAYNTFFYLHRPDDLVVSANAAEALTALNSVAAFDLRSVRVDEQDAELSLIQLEESVRTSAMLIFSELQTANND